MDAEFSIWMASKTRWVHLTKVITLPTLPRLGEFMKFRNSEMGDYFAWKITQITYRENKEIEVWTELLDNIDDRGYSFEEEDEFDAYYNSYLSEGWVCVRGIKPNNRFLSRHTTCQCPVNTPMLLDTRAILEQKLDLFPNPDLYETEKSMLYDQLPVICLQCAKRVNLAALNMHPVFEERLREMIYEWAVTFTAIKLVSARKYDAWRDDQIANLKAPIHRFGLSIRDDLDAIRNCYYYILSGNYTICDQCHGNLEERIDDHHYKQLVCHQCRLVYL